MRTIDLVIASLVTALLSMLSLSAPAAGMTLSGIPPTTGTVGELYRFAPVVLNANGSRLQFTYVNKPVWSGNYPSSGLILGIPREPGVYANIRIRAWDGKRLAMLPPFTIHVTDTPTVLAPAGSRLTYKVANKPAWTQFNTATGALWGTPTASSVGTFANIRISVLEGENTASLPAFSIAVAPAVPSSGALGTAFLSWSKPVKNTDGSILTNLAGYLIRYGTSTGTLNNQFSIASATSTGAEIQNLSRGKWYFEIAAINAANIAGQFSPTASKTIQ